MIITTVYFLLLFANFRRRSTRQAPAAAEAA